MSCYLYNVVDKKNSNAKNAYTVQVKLCVGRNESLVSVHKKDVH